jgi:hypothetical protein
MIDPLTALSVAAAAVSQAKTLLNAGRDAHGALVKFAGAVSDINYAAEKAKNPSVWKSLTGSAEAEAIEIFSAQKKIEQMRREVETLIGYTYGQTGLEEYKDTLRKVKAQRQKVEYRRQEIKETIFLWTFTFFILVTGIAGLAIFAYFLKGSVE